MAKARKKVVLDEPISKLESLPSVAARFKPSTSISSKLGTIDLVYNKPPSVIAHKGVREYFEQEAVWNRFRRYREMETLDPKLMSSRLRFAEAVRMAYKGMVLDVGVSTERAEEEMKREISDFENHFDCGAAGMLVQIYAGQLSRDYNSVTKLSYETGRGITYLQHVPMEILTILENKEQKGKTNHQIWEKNYYMINESNTMYNQPEYAQSESEFAKEQIWEARDILHIEADPCQHVVEDILGRTTYGVYSVSMYEPLKTPVQTKFNSLLIDILWRMQMVPRIHWKLDMAAFNPRSYTNSTKSARRTAAINEAKDACDDFYNEIVRLEPDQPIVTDDGATGVVIESKSETYRGVNELVKQLNEEIVSSMGIPVGVMGGKESQSAAYTASEFTTIHAEAILDTIAKAIIKLFKFHLATKYPAGEKNGEPVVDDYGNYVCKKYSKKMLDSIHYKKTKIIMRDRVEMFSAAAVMEETGDYMMDEIRVETGFNPLTDEQKKQHAEERQMFGKGGMGMSPFGQNQNPQTPSRVAADIKKNPPTSPNEKLPSEQEHDVMRKTDKGRSVSEIKRGGKGEK